MTNFEHYKEEIKRGVEKSTLSSILTKCGCKDFSSYGLTRWYLAEYVEPYKLTQFEKDILQNLDKDTSIIFKNWQIKEIWLGNNDTILYSISSLFPNVVFISLEWDKKYKIADILANCEVVD